jgi:hypothetical protein
VWKLLGFLGALIVSSGLWVALLAAAWIGTWE